MVDTADGEVSLAWEEPENDGGSKIIAYVVERRDVKRKTWTLATDRADTPEYCVSGLQQDSLYLFRVCARNRVGPGPIVATDDAVQAKNKFGKQTLIVPQLFLQSPHFVIKLFFYLLPISRCSRRSRKCWPWCGEQVWSHCQLGAS